MSFVFLSLILSRFGFRIAWDLYNFGLGILIQNEGNKSLEIYFLGLRIGIVFYEKYGNDYLDSRFYIASDSLIRSWKKYGLELFGKIIFAK